MPVHSPIMFVCKVPFFETVIKPTLQCTSERAFTEQPTLNMGATTLYWEGLSSLVNGKEAKPD